MGQKRLAWALFVLLLSTLVCCQPTELILGYFVKKKKFQFPPPPPRKRGKLPRPCNEMSARTDSRLRLRRPRPCRRRLRQIRLSRRLLLRKR